jgi:hypothetical protein
MKRKERAAPRAYRFLLADLADQLRKWGIDFIKQQRRVGRRRTPEWAAPIDDDDLMAVRCEKIRRKRSRNSCTDDKNVALNVACELARPDCRRPIRLPNRRSAPQIAMRADHWDSRI